MRKLRLQIVGILILAVLLPSLPVAFTAHALINRSLDPLLETGIEEGARAGLDMSRDILDAEKQAFQQAIVSGAKTDTLTADEHALLDDREQSALSTWSRAERPGESARGAVQVLIPPERMPLGGKDILIARISGPDGAPVWVTESLSPELVSRTGKLIESIQLLEALRSERESIVRSLIAAFLVTYGIVVVVVLLLGLFLASRVTRPLAALGDGIEQVATGNLGAQVPVTAGGEIGKLIRDFNNMSGRLEEQQTELIRLGKLAGWRQMARRLAHEIKNPLTPIQLAAEQIRDEYKGSDTEYRKLVDEGTSIVEEEVSRLRALVTEFSQFARLPEPNLASVSIDDQLHDVANLYGEQKLSVRFEEAIAGAVADRSPSSSLWCDGDQIHRALINLIDNALAAQEETGASSPVEIVADTIDDGRKIVIRVQDRGGGIEKSKRSRVFEPDFTTKAHGTGLGLAIVESTIRNHGGLIEIEDRDGGGAIFTLTLPSSLNASSDGESR